MEAVRVVLQMDTDSVCPQPGVSPLCMQYLRFLSCELGRVTGRLFCKVLCIFFRKMPHTFREVISTGCKTAHLI